MTTKKKSRSPGIVELTGIALGAMGMTLDDFDRIEPEEFDEVCRAWNRTQVQDSWERARFLARCCLQPHCKQSLKVTDVCRFPWDKGRTESRPAAESTRERFEELVRRTENVTRPFPGDRLSEKTANGRPDNQVEDSERCPHHEPESGGKTEHPCQCDHKKV